MDCSRTKKIIVTKFFLFIKMFYILDFFLFQGLIHEIKNLIVPDSLKNLQSGPIVIHYVLYNNFFCTQLACIFVLQKYFCYVHDDTHTSLLLFFHKIWYLLRVFFHLLPFSSLFSSSEKF